MQLRYDYRIYPTPGQQTALARVIRDNQAVYVEDLCVVGLARTRLAKSVHDAGWSGFTTVHDRDLNAARNVLALGRRESLNACGGDVRPGNVLAVAGEAGTRRGAV